MAPGGRGGGHEPKGSPGCQGAELIEVEAFGQHDAPLGLCPEGIQGRVEDAGIVHVLWREQNFIESTQASSEYQVIVMGRIRTREKLGLPHLLHT